MAKKLILTITLIIISIFSLNLSYNTVYAEDVGPVLKDSTVTPDDYNPGPPTSASGADKIKDIGNIIIGVLQVVGTILSVAVLAVLGIKYMIGSVEERAEYKKTMMPYLIGAIMVFGITNLLAIIANISSSLF